jgi:hypothetical protein
MKLDIHEQSPDGKKDIHEIRYGYVSGFLVPIACV